MKLSQKQNEIRKYVVKNDPIQIILHGAVRSGKTFLDNMFWIRHIGSMKEQRRDFIITGHTIGAIERNVLKPLRDDFGLSIRLNIRNNFDLFGNKVHCFGADKYDSYKQMTGMTAYGWYGNEITLQHKNTISEAFNRCSGDGSRIFWDTNPDYPEHHIKREYVDKSEDLLPNGKERIHAWHFELADNPILSTEYIENLKASTPPGMWYDRKIKGLWVAAEGAVYDLFNREKHVIERFKIPDHWPRYRVIDYGYTNPFVCLWGALDEDGRLYIYHEYYKAQTLLKDHAAYINSYIETKDNGGMIRYTDTIADHDAQDNAEMKNYGIRTRNANKTVNLGIEKVSERMVVQNDGKPRLFIFRGCEHTIREHSAYRWQEHKDGKPIKEEPLKVDDHTCLVENTKIATARGIINIKDVVENDYVYTLNGFKKVYNTALTGIKHVITNKGITGTKDHKIITREGRVDLCDLTNKDTLYILDHKKYQKDMKWERSRKLQRLSCLMESIITKAEKNNITDVEVVTLNEVLDIYTEMYGNSIMGLYLTGIIFTTKMVIKKIMNWITSNASKVENIFLNILKNGIVKTLIDRKNILKVSDHLRKSGIAQKPVRNGILNMVKKVGKIVNMLKWYVSNAKGYSKHLRLTELNIARMHANQMQEEKAKSITKIENVKPVVKFFKSINMLKGFFVQENVIKKVYNISVDSEHQLYANNILVSNCDALRYLVADLDLTKKMGVSDIPAGYLGL